MLSCYEPMMRHGVVGITTDAMREIKYKACFSRRRTHKQLKTADTLEVKCMKRCVLSKLHRLAIKNVLIKRIYKFRLQLTQQDKEIWFKHKRKCQVNVQYFPLNENVTGTVTVWVSATQIKSLPITTLLWCMNYSSNETLWRATMHQLTCAQLQ